MTLYSKAITLFFLALQFSILQAQPKDLFDLPSSQRYAEYLYSSENFKQAAIEYERLIVMDSAGAKIYQLKAISCYRQDDNLQVGFKRINTWFTDDEKRQSPINKEFGMYLIGLGFYNDAIAFLEECNDMPQNDKATLTALSHCFLAQWAEAEAALAQVTQKNASSQILKQVSQDGLKMRFKKPGVAAVLSIIPGLGRVYTGNYADAGISALTITTIAWQAYTGFDKNGTSSFYGWLTATLATAFYFGNIYGSYRSAQLYNKQQMDALYVEILRAYRLIA